MAQRISIVGLNKSEVLATLYNASRPQGMGFVHYEQKPMTVDEAQELLAGGNFEFDYIKGRVMKIDLSGNEIDCRGYDRGNGQGAAEQAVNALRQTGSVNSPIVQTMHRTGKVEAARLVREYMYEDLVDEVHGDVQVVTIGLADVADTLGPAVDRALEDD